MRKCFSGAGMQTIQTQKNFLFMFYGPNAKVVSDGENAANYQNIKL